MKYSTKITLSLLPLLLMGCELPPDFQPVHPPSPWDALPTPRDAPAAPTQVTLAWNSYPLDASVVGFNIYSGSSSGQYDQIVPVPGVTTTNASVPAPRGVFRFYAITATNSAGLESAYSAEAGYRAPLLSFTVHSLYRTNLTSGVVFTNATWWLYEPEEPARFYYHEIKADE